jgi:hypothetical protein
VAPEFEPNSAIFSQGFKSVALITNDFIECIPFGNLHFLLDSIGGWILAQTKKKSRNPQFFVSVGWYCLQQDDTNISFTAIGPHFSCVRGTYKD